jgi:hypothetical protein
MMNKHTHMVRASGIPPCFKGLENDCAPIIANAPRTHVIILDKGLTVSRPEEWSWH